MNKYIIDVYKTISGKEPYYIWLMSLDGSIRTRILTRIDKVENGHFGDFEFVDTDIYELRFHFSPGYRIYYVKFGNTVLLLTGGDKKSQSKDIDKAKEYWRDYKERL